MRKKWKKCHWGCVVPPNVQNILSAASISQEVLLGTYLISWISIIQILPFHSTSDFRIYFYEKKLLKKKIII